MVIFYDELREMVSLMYGTLPIVHVGRFVYSMVYYCIILSVGEMGRERMWLAGGVRNCGGGRG